MAYDRKANSYWEATVMTNATATEFTLVLTAEETEQLRSVLEEAMAEVHAERRRTESPAYQQLVRHEEALVQSLLTKVRQLGH
jgi:hypothetical protein